MVLVDRRELLRLSASAASVAALSMACVQLNLTTRKVWQLGMLANDDGANPRWDAFHAGLRDLGWIEGQNLTTTRRVANGSTGRLDALASDLASIGVDVIVTAGTEAALAVQRATRIIPIVVAAMNDPVGSGLVSSFARPGGNITGLSLLSPQLTPKWLELLVDLAPGGRRLALLANSDNPSSATLVEQAQAAAPANLELRFLDARGGDELPHAFDLASDWQAHAMVVLPDSLFYVARAQLAQLARQHRLPTLYSAREYTEAGGLLSYGADHVELFRRAARFVDRIFHGARASELPIEQPSTFELVANITAAQQLGIVFPSSILLQATVVQ